MIYIAEYEGYENNEHKLEITGKTVSKEEYDDFMANFKFYGQYHQFKERLSCLLLKRWRL